MLVKILLTQKKTESYFCSACDPEIFHRPDLFLNHAMQSQLVLGGGRGGEKQGYMYLGQFLLGKCCWPLRTPTPL